MCVKIEFKETLNNQTNNKVTEEKEVPLNIDTKSQTVMVHINLINENPNVKHGGTLVTH